MEVLKKIKKRPEDRFFYRLKKVASLYLPRKKTPISQNKIWQEISIQGVPQEVVHVFEEHGLTDSNCKFVVESRMNLQGHYSSVWLALSDRALVVVEQTQTAVQLLNKVTIAEIQDCTVVTFTGGGVLKIQMKTSPIDLIRYDLQHAELFAAISETIHKFRKENQGLDFTEILKKQHEQLCSSCYRTLPAKSKVCPHCLKNSSVLLRILGFTSPYYKSILLIMAMMVAGIGISLVPPQITKILVDDILPYPDKRQGLLLYVGVLALVLVAKHVLDILKGRLAVKIGGYVTSSIRFQAYQHLQSLPLSFFNKQETGSLMARIHQNVNQMEGFLVEGIQFTIVNLLMIVGILGIMIWMNPVLGLLVLLPMPIVVFLSKIFWKDIHLRFSALMRSISSFSSQLNDALSGIRIIKAFGQEKQEVERFHSGVIQYRDRVIDAEQTWQTLVPLLNLLIQTSLVLVWYFGASQVWKDDSFTIGSLLAYIGYLGMIYGPLQLVTRLNDWMSRAMTAAAQVFEILDTTPELFDRPNAIPMKSIDGAVEFKQVTFSYEKGSPVLQDISFYLEPNRMYGLVGHSGAGKSTIINLLGRLYDIDSGQILIDGVDLRECQTRDLRQHIGYVLQDSFLFKNTVAKNIAYARPDATEEEIIEAAVMANAHEFIMNLPHGYDTVLGERGQNLSGGEKQRISIARAILHNPKILILDEATSSVDTETEAKIQQALYHLIQGKTTIAIAHRLSTLRHADELLVIDQGKLVERGTHDELMKLDNGIYQRLVTIQTEWSKTIAIGN